MRILYINTLYAPYIRGGAEITLQTQVEGMRARGHDVAVLTIGPQNEGVIEDAVNGVPVHRAAYQNVYFHYREEKAPIWKRVFWHWNDRDNAAMEAPIREVVSRFKPDVVACHNLAGFSIAAWRTIHEAGIPIVQVLHDQYLLCARSTMFNRGKVCERQCAYCKVARLKHSEASKQVSAVIGVSQFILNKLTSAGYFEDVPIKAAIHNARPGGLPHLPLKNTDSTKADQETIVGFIGTLAPNKGIELLLQCFSRIDAGNHLRLIVAGTGDRSYVERLKSQYAASNIEFLGQVKPSEFFPRLDVTVVPSVWDEPLGNVVFESFAYGVPVIGSKRGGIPEMITVGTNGILFDPGSPEILEGILYTIQDRLSNLLSSADIQITSKVFYDIDGFLDRYENIYSSSIY